MANCHAAPIRKGCSPPAGSTVALNACDLRASLLYTLEERPLRSIHRCSPQKVYVSQRWCLDRAWHTGVVTHLQTAVLSCACHAFHERFRLFAIHVLQRCPHRVYKCNIVRCALSVVHQAVVLMRTVSVAEPITSCVASCNVPILYKGRSNTMAWWI